jgi:hypothetical protein
MSNGNLSWITNFIWNIADDVLRDVYVRGKYRDVILPMVVIRRLDVVLEPTKQQVIDMKAHLDEVGIDNQVQALRSAAGWLPAETRVDTVVLISPCGPPALSGHAQVFRCPPMRVNSTSAARDSTGATCCTIQDGR